MRKLMVLVAMLALMLAAASPAFAQDVTVTTGDSVEFNAVCQNIAGEINAVGVNAANANANADAGDDAVAVASVSQSQGIFVVQANSCLNNFFWWWWF